MLRTHRAKGLAVKAAALTGVSMLVTAGFAPAMAQSAPRQFAASAPEEIIVTARKREESIMKAPLLIQAIPAKQIEDMHITKIESLSTVAPGMFLNYAFAQVGITAYVRGLGNAGSATFVDQTLGLNIDGFTSSTGALFRSGVFDAAQIEVLKGPQSLFFGKSTAAGMIAITSADPTPTWQAKATVSYEFDADEMEVNGFVAGPLTDTLGVRLAGYHSTMKGYLHNPWPGVASPRLPNEEDDGGRLTLKYNNPDVGLRVKLKASYSYTAAHNSISNINQRLCAGGVFAPGPFAAAGALTGIDNCKADTEVFGVPDGVPYDPKFDFSRTDVAEWARASGHPLFKDGKGYNYGKVGLAVLSLDYDLTPGLTLSSVTGIASIKAADAGRNINTVLGISDIATDPMFNEWSEELRLTSNWKDSWINFMVGGLYTRQVRKDLLVLSWPNNPTIFQSPAFLGGSLSLFTRGITSNSSRMDTPTQSVFGQVLLTPVQKWELAAGLRYTHVSKRWTSIFLEGNNSPATLGEQVTHLNPNLIKIVENVVTPEVTLSYKPTDDLTAFISYKHGYKGPGANSTIGPAVIVTDADFANATGTRRLVAGERTKGVEAGLKAQLFDRQLSMSLIGYLYNYNNLQVSFLVPALSTAVLGNAANARVQGVEFSGDYHPASVPGLGLSYQLAYNDTHYRSFPGAGCYVGQTRVTDPNDTANCHPVAPGSTVFVQNLGGKPGQMAPKITGQVGADYTWEMGNYVAGLNANVQYSSSYYAVADLNPISKIGGYAIINAGARVGKADGSWEMALLCRNCNDTRYVVNGIDGGTTPASASINIGRPWTLLLQLTVKPNLL